MRPSRISKNSHEIRRMFAGISGRYDFLNHLLSLNVDRLWRKKAVRTLDPRPGEKILDLCTGTADLALEIARFQGNRGRGPGNPGAGPALVVGADFCREMILLGNSKRRARGEKNGAPLQLLLADALQLPFPDGCFDGAAVAFGIRNLENLNAGLGEMLRVLRPGGRAALLEFTTPPRPWFRSLFRLYFHKILPRIGAWIAPSRDPGSGRAYSYLPESVNRFPGADELAGAMAGAGFERIRYVRLTMGIACIHLGERPGAVGGAVKSEPPAEPVV